MAKKEKIEFTPSKYQQDIYDFIAHGQGNAVINAKAGCGKTTTLIKALEFMPTDSRVLFTAFNREIVSEIEKKTKKISNVVVKVQSIHGIGLSICKQNLTNLTLPPDEFKYRSYIYKNLPLLTKHNLKRFSRSRYMQCSNNVRLLNELGRLNLCQTAKDLEKIVERHEIDIVADEIDVALKVMEWGKTHTETIDYTDMIWLPHVLNMQTIGFKFDFIIIDEAQDMNRAQRELVMKCRKINTRFIAAGDNFQCLYSFSGSDPESFNILSNMPNTINLPLSISYRCADNIVAEAQKIVPEIEKNEDGRAGEVIYNVSLDDIKDGDMILCRNNAPLVGIYNKFLRMGKRSYIRGKDIGANLIEMVKNTKQSQLNSHLLSDGVFARLYEDLFITRDKIISLYNIDHASAINTQMFANKLDMINALKVLSEGLKTTDELLEKINQVFPKNKKDMKTGISLSTIHKSKGLEADNVYIACQSLMPSKHAKAKWEIEQENNLIYVAYTRAKNKLGFLHEDQDELNQFNNIESFLNKIEPIICKLVGKQYTPPCNEDYTSGISAHMDFETKKEQVIKNRTKTLNMLANKPFSAPSFQGFTTFNKTQKRLHR